jgi:hypothetical protein
VNEHDVVARIQVGRRITGMSAILLPYADDGAIDWAAAEAHVSRTVTAGLTPAVNMDTGYVQLLDAADKERVLDMAAAVAGGAFVAGAYAPTAPVPPSTSTRTSRRQPRSPSGAGRRCCSPPTG